MLTLYLLAIPKQGEAPEAWQIGFQSGAITLLGIANAMILLRINQIASMMQWLLLVKQFMRIDVKATFSTNWLKLIFSVPLNVMFKLRYIQDISNLSKGLFGVILILPHPNWRIKLALDCNAWSFVLLWEQFTKSGYGWVVSISLISGVASCLTQLAYQFMSWLVFLSQDSNPFRVVQQELKNSWYGTRLFGWLLYTFLLFIYVIINVRVMMSNLVRGVRQYLLNVRVTMFNIVGGVRQYASTPIGTSSPNGDPEEEGRPKKGKGKTGKQELFTAVNEPDTGQTTTNPYILANRHLSSGAKPTTLEVLNSILAYFNMSITAEEYSIITNIKPVNVSYPLEFRNEAALAVLGSSSGRDKTMVAGVYVFTNTVTDEEYVGSALRLGVRVRSYTQSRGLAENRKIASSIKLYGNDAFNLRVYKINDSDFQHIHAMDRDYVLKLVKTLEQYLMLELKPALNTIMVSGGVPSATAGTGRPTENPQRRKTVYVYNNDMTELLQVVTMVKDFGTLFGIGNRTVYKCLAHKELLYGSFVLSTELTDPSMTPSMSLERFQALIADMYKNRMSRRDHTRPKANMTPVVLTDLLSEDKTVYNFTSIGQVKSFTQEAGRPLYRKVLSKRTTFEFKGWKVEFPSNNDST